MSGVPKGCASDRLKDVAAINAVALSTGTDPDYEFDYLEISNVDYHGIVDPNAIERLRFEDAPSRARRRVAAGSTVISSVRPNLQAVAFFPDAPAHFVCSTGFNVVEPQPSRLSPQFAYYHLISENARQHFEAAATGVGYPAVGDKEFNAIAVPLPSLPEQQRIAAYLDASCAAIDAAVAAKRNGANEVLNIRVVSIGLIDRSPVHPRQVFADALSDRASGVIVAHNHPSGGVEPSQSDININAKLKAAGEIVGIELLDHIIFNRAGYFSFLEAGRL